MKVVSSIGRMLSEPIYLSKIEDNVILCVEIKFTNIQRTPKVKATLWVFTHINTKSKGNFMGFY